MLRNKYQYLKVLIIDDISVIGKETFRSSIKSYRAKSPFGGVSLLVLDCDSKKPKPKSYVHETK